MKTIEDVWRGNYVPCEIFVEGNKEYKKALADLAEKEELVNSETGGKLNDDIQEMITAQQTLSCIADMCAFSSGVKFGIRLMIEAICS